MADAASGATRTAPPPLLVWETIDTAGVLAAVADAAAGANVLFTGTTRGVTAGVHTRRLVYEAHEPLARAVLARLRDEAAAGFGLVRCAVTHRLGEVGVGETSVAVATSGPHRREAFAAAQWLMDRIKSEVPIWKAEEGADGAVAWVHPESAARPDGLPPAAVVAADTACRKGAP